jgi:hypothetical protein
MTVLPALYVGQLGENRRQNVIELLDGTLSREVSLCYYRPYAKWNIINRLAEEITVEVKKQLK